MDELSTEAGECLRAALDFYNEVSVASALAALAIRATLSDFPEGSFTVTPDAWMRFEQGTRKVAEVPELIGGQLLAARIKALRSNPPQYSQDGVEWPPVFAKLFSEFTASMGEALPELTYLLDGESVERT
jgi:hypothetical protein